MHVVAVIARSSIFTGLTAENQRAEMRKSALSNYSLDVPNSGDNDEGDDGGNEDVRRRK